MDQKQDPLEPPTFLESLKWVWRNNPRNKNFSTEFYDKFDTNPVWGYVCFFVAMALAVGSVLPYVHYFNNFPYLGYIAAITITIMSIFLPIEATLIWILCRLTR